MIRKNSCSILLFTLLMLAALCVLPKAAWGQAKGNGYANGSPSVVSTDGSGNIIIKPPGVPNANITLTPSGTGLTVFGGTGLKFPDGSVQSSAAGASPNNSVVYAANEPGADAGAKMQACVTAAAAATGLTCDARGLPSASISSTVAIPASVTLELPGGTITGTVVPMFTLNNGSRLIGQGYGTSSTVVQGPSGAGALIQAAALGTNYQYCSVDNVKLTGDSPTSADGSVGLNTENLMDCHFSNIFASSFDTGIQVGGTSASNASYYNIFSNVAAFNDFSYDLHVEHYASVNQFNNFFAHGNSLNNHTYIQLDGYGNNFEGRTDCETSGSNTSICLDVTGFNNYVASFYIEGLNTGIQMEAGAEGNIILPGQGSSIGSGGTVNVASQTATDLLHNIIPQSFSNSLISSFRDFPVNNFHFMGGNGDDYCDLSGQSGNGTVSFIQGLNATTPANYCSIFAGGMSLFFDTSHRLTISNAINSSATATLEGTSSSLTGVITILGISTALTSTTSLSGGTATARSIIPVDATAGAFTVTLPS